MASNHPGLKASRIPLAVASLWAATLPASVRGEPRGKLVPLSPDQVPRLEPTPAPAPAQPQPSRTPYPAPGYARWYLPPAPPDSYLDDLPPETEGRHTGFFMRLA